MGHEIYELSWEEVYKGTENILKQIQERNLKFDTIVPVLRGGATLGNFLSNNMDVESSFIHTRRSNSNEINAEFGTTVLIGMTNEDKIEGKDILIVDDLLDKGTTMEFVVKEIKKYNPRSIHIAVLYNFVKVEEPEKYLVGLSMEEKKWIVFPWEKKIEI